MKDFETEKSPDGRVMLNDGVLDSLGLNMAELSRRSGVPYSSLVKYFHLTDPRGLPSPTLRNARKITKALGLPLDDVCFLGE